MSEKAKKKIAMIVYNSVSHDARVLKEAQSLVKAGHHVRIFGIQDNKVSIAFETTSAGIEIERANWKPKMYRNVSWLVIYLLFFSLIVVNALIALTVLKSQLTVLELFAIVVNFFMLAFFFLLWRRYNNLAKSYASNASTPNTPTSNTSTPNTSTPNTPTPNTPTPKFISLIKGLNRESINYLFKIQNSHIAMKFVIQLLLGNFKPDIVHCHDLTTLPAGAEYCSKYSVKLVYDSHEIYEEMGSFGEAQKFVYYQLQKRYSKYVDYFITINESIAVFLTTRYPALPEAVIIKNATRPIKEAIEYDGRLHEASGLDRDVNILLYQGGFGQKRGLDILVKSAVLLPHGWVLVMMGWGSFEDKLKKIASEVDLKGKKVRFIPAAPHSELPYWTAGARIGVIPYENTNLNHWYCTPNKLWEYPNAGVPLLVSPFPEMKKIIDEYEIGWFLPDPVTPDGIAEQVNKLSDFEIQNAKINCAKFLAEDNWSTYEEKLVGNYKDWLENR